MAPATFMPVRSSNSSVLKWPERHQVDAAVRAWAQAGAHPELLRLGYFGSYARGDWRVGSDLDPIALVSRSHQRFVRRALSWDLSPLPVAADLIVYTHRDWKLLQEAGGRFAHTLAHETVWVAGKDLSDDGNGRI